MKTYVIKGYEVLFDDEFELKQEDCYWDVTAKGYVRFIKRGVYDEASWTRVHRFILGLKNGEGKIVDHINRNPLDNRIQNLRIVTLLENRHNTSPRGTKKGMFKQKGDGYRVGKSYKYVYRSRKYWGVHISTKKKEYYGGLFKTFEEALARAITLDIETEKEKGYRGLVALG